MVKLIDSIGSGVPKALTEIITLGRTLKKRINGRLEHLRGSALGFRNLTNYIVRSLLEAGGFRPLLHPHL
jgi:transposase